MLELMASTIEPVKATVGPETVDPETVGLEKLNLLSIIYIAWLTSPHAYEF